MHYLLAQKITASIRRNSVLAKGKHRTRGIISQVEYATKLNKQVNKVIK